MTIGTANCKHTPMGFSTCHFLSNLIMPYYFFDISDKCNSVCHVFVSYLYLISPPELIKYFFPFQVKGFFSLKHFCIFSITSGDTSVCSFISSTSFLIYFSAHETLIHIHMTIYQYCLFCIQHSCLVLFESHLCYILEYRLTCLLFLNLLQLLLQFPMPEYIFVYYFQAVQDNNHSW